MEMIISILEEKPELWDKYIEQYKDRNKTRDAWKSVCGQLKTDFELLNDGKKKEFGAMLGPSYTLLSPSLESEDVNMGSSSAQALKISALVLMAVIGSGANILVVIVFYRRPTLRSPSNRFVMSLVLANLLTSLVVDPIIIAELLHRHSPALSWLHQVAYGLTTFTVTASILSILAIAVDRYNAVLSPLHYAMTITRQRSRGMITGVWGLSSLLATPQFLGAFSKNSSHFQASSSIPSEKTMNCTTPGSSEVFTLTYALVLVTVGFTLPLFALCWIYARMYNAAHLNSERTRRHSVCTNPGEVISASRSCSRGNSLELPIPPNSGTPDNLRRTWRNPPLSQLAVPKRRSSNASFSALLFREEGRAVKTAAMVIASYILCWTPYFVTLLVDTWSAVGTTNGIQNISIIPESFRFLSLISALSSGCITPFIYVFRNDTARKEAIRVLTWWRAVGGKYNGNVTRCSRDAGPHYDNITKPQSFGPPVQDNFALRRQSLSYCDSVSVQSFHIPALVTECSHCSDPFSGPGTADFVATYDVIESPVEDGTKHKPPDGSEVKNDTNTSNVSPLRKPGTRTRRESVTFRLAFLPQRRCQTCIRQNSDSSSGSGHPLIREGDSTEAKGSPVIHVNNNSVSSLVRLTVSQKRQQFLIGRQGSSGEELTISESEPGTPRQLLELQRKGSTGKESCDNNTPRQKFLQYNNNNNNDSEDNEERGVKTGAVILELDEQINDGVNPLQRVTAVFQFQETALERLTPSSVSQEHYSQCSIDLEPPASEEILADSKARQDSCQSDTTVRQDSNYSDITVDSGVVVDIGVFNRSHSSSSSLSAVSVNVPQRPKRHRHKLQRLAAVEDEEISSGGQTISRCEENSSMKDKLKSSFKSRFHRPTFKLPRCDF